MTTPKTPRLTDSEIAEATGKPTTYGYTFYVTTDVYAALDAQMMKSEERYQGLVTAARAVRTLYDESKRLNTTNDHAMHKAVKALRDALEGLGE